MRIMAPLAPGGVGVCRGLKKQAGHAMFGPTEANKGGAKYRNTNAPLF